MAKRGRPRTITGPEGPAANGNPLVAFRLSREEFAQLEGKAAAEGTTANLLARALLVAALTASHPNK